MLPFLKNKRMSGIVMMKMKDNSPEAVKEEGEPMPDLMIAAEDLLSAIAMKDTKKVADALEAAFHICNSMPEQEENFDEVSE